MKEESLAAVLHFEVARPPTRGEHFHPERAVAIEQVPRDHRLGVGVEELLAVMNCLQAPVQLAELRTRGPTIDLFDHRGIETVPKTIEPAGRSRE